MALPSNQAASIRASHLRRSMLDDESSSSHRAYTGSEGREADLKDDLNDIQEKLIAIGKNQKLVWDRELCRMSRRDPERAKALAAIRTATIKTEHAAWLAVTNSKDDNPSRVSQDRNGSKNLAPRKRIFRMLWDKNELEAKQWLLEMALGKREFVSVSKNAKDLADPEKLKPQVESPAASTSASHSRRSDVPEVPLREKMNRKPIENAETKAGSVYDWDNKTDSGYTSGCTQYFGDRESSASDDSLRYLPGRKEGLPQLSKYLRSGSRDSDSSYNEDRTHAASFYNRRGSSRRLYPPGRSNRVYLRGGQLSKNVLGNDGDCIIAGSIPSPASASDASPVFASESSPSEQGGMKRKYSDLSSSTSWDIEREAEPSRRVRRSGAPSPAYYPQFLPPTKAGTAKRQRIGSGSITSVTDGSSEDGHMRSGSADVMKAVGDSGALADAYNADSESSMPGIRLMEQDTERSRRLKRDERWRMTEDGRLFVPE